LSDDDLVNRYYGQAYSDVHYQGAQGLYTKLMHLALEKNLGGDYPAILEIGSGAGEHTKYVKHNFKSYDLVDLSDNNPLSEVPVALVSKITFTCADARHLPWQDNSFDRILCTCVLLHVQEVEKVLSEMRRVAKHKADLTLYLPCDPGMIYRIIRHWTSHRKQSRVLGIDNKETKYLWSLEHRNHFLGVFSAIKYIFRNDNYIVNRYPFIGLSWNFNLFIVVRISINKTS